MIGVFWVRPGHEWVNLSQGDCDWGILGGGHHEDKKSQQLKTHHSTTQQILPPNAQLFWGSEFQLVI